MRIAFFDLDQTLIAVNSARMWIRREVALGQLTRSQALRAATWLVRYQLGFASVEDAVGRAIAALAGTRALDIRERTDSFYDRQVRPLFRPGGLAEVERARSAGARTVLLTSSSNYMADRVGAELKLDGLLCNHLEVDTEGFHTGRTVGPLCFGVGKLAHARAEASRTGVGLDECSFFTDSIADLPVLEQVGRAVAVNPDPRLSRLAKKRGWEVVDWGTP
ncbi:MAG: HAD family phosphatase [Archangiaceae bacterium]|nr:HAD family phosphatase [Archangiaceae bacterium]